MRDEVMRRMELELDSRRDEIRALRAKVEAYKKGYEDQVALKDRHEAGYRETIVQLQTQLATLTARVEALEQELNEQQEISEWYGSLVKRAQIGTKETPSLRAYIEQTEAERDRLREAAKDVVDSFEMDYMIDGVIVDRPHGQCERLYRVCKAALRGEGG